MHTLVQHSGGAAGKPAFVRAVEEASVPADQERAVREAGGILFRDYAEASRYSHEVNYPPEVRGMAPRAQGTFHPELKVGGLALYLPSDRDLALVSIEGIMES